MKCGIDLSPERGIVQALFMKGMETDFVNRFGLPIAIVRMDRDGRIKDGGESLCQLIGEHAKPGRKQRYLSDYMPPEKRDAFDEIWKILAEGEPVVRRALPLITSDGVQHVFAASFVPEREHDEWTGVSAALHDLDAQKELAEALEAAEERFNVILRESSDPILTIGAEGDLLSANPAFEQLTGIGSDELLRGEKGWADFVYEEDVERVEKAVRQKLERRELPTVEFRMVDRDRNLGFYEQSFSELHDESGGLRGLLGMIRNVTHRKERELELLRHAENMQRRTEQIQSFSAKLRRYFVATSELPKDEEEFLNGVCDILFDMYKPVQVFIAVNERDRVYSRSREAPTDRFADEHRGDMACSVCGRVLREKTPLYRPLLSPDDTLCEEGCTSRPDITAYLGAPLRDSAGKVHGVLAMIDDSPQHYDNMDIELLTVASLQVASRLVREKQEQAQRELEHNLRQMQKMEAVGMLAGGIAHDFNNYLSSILGFSSFLKGRVEEDSPLYRDIELIEKSARNASDLTRQLLAFARDRDVAHEEVRLDRQVRDAMKLIRRSLSKNIVTEAHIAEHIPPLLGDGGQMNQVLMNLCLNAGDAMQETGGVLSIRLEYRALTEREKNAMVDMTESEYICLSVNDTGPGIVPEAQKRIFDPFYTTKKDRGGSGLGLSVVYGIVRNHGGNILLDSEPGKGACFQLYLPACESKSERFAASDSAQRKAGEGRGECILIIEDEEYVRQVVGEILERCGYKAISVGSGKEAIERYREEQEKIDLVFLDLIMPGMDGAAIFDALQKIHPAVRVLLTSGHTRLGQAEALLEKGALGLVHKPYVTETLLTQIRHALKKTA